MSGQKSHPAGAGLGRRKLLQSAGLAVGGAMAMSGVAPRSHASAVSSGVFDVVVVGAGFSGLTAARDLVRAGVGNIAVLEARDRVGGRSWNQEPAPGLVADAGPTWVGPGQTAIHDLLRELGIGTIRNHDSGDIVVSVGGQVQRIPGKAPAFNEGLVERLDALALTVPLDAPWRAESAAQYDAMTYADYLGKQGLADEELLLVSIACQLTFGARPEDLSFLYILFYIHSADGYSRLESMEGGAQQDRIVGGTQAVPLRMAADLGPLVRLDHPVTLIDNWDPAPGATVRLHTPAGVVEARSVILALSPSQATGIRFAPALPVERAGLISHWPRSGSGIKVSVAYAMPFWRAKGLNGQVVCADGPIMWSADTSPADASKGQLMCFSSPIGDMPPRTGDERKAAILDLYAQCFGEEARNPIGYVEHDWSQETYTRGCVSPLTPGVLSRWGKALRVPNGRLVWAGTETAEIWMGYMDGAVRAGHRAALEALRALAVEV